MGTSENRDLGNEDTSHTRPNSAYRVNVTLICISTAVTVAPALNSHSGTATSPPLNHTRQ